MKFLKIYFLILIIFFETGNVLSVENIFNVNNIKLVKKPGISNEVLANRAIKKGFLELIDKILLEEDKKRLSQLSLPKVKELVSYYQVLNDLDKEDKDKINFNIFFDKDKLHDLFYKTGINYSKITNKEVYLLPLLKKDNEIYIYNQNFFYTNWNKDFKSEIIDFILPIENIEVVQKINFHKDNLIGINLKDLFFEYPNKNLAFILIEDLKSKNIKTYLKLRILGKDIGKNIIIEKSKLNENNENLEIIKYLSDEITNIIKEQNLIDIRTPSFLNTKLKVNDENNLVDLRKRLDKIDMILNIYVQEFNNEYVFIKIKYLGKLNSIIRQLEKQNIILSLIGDEWSFKIL